MHIASALLFKIIKPERGRKRLSKVNMIRES